MLLTESRFNCGRFLTYVSVQDTPQAGEAAAQEAPNPMGNVSPFTSNCFLIFLVHFLMGVS